MAPQNPLRKLGKSGPQIPALGYGCMGLGAFYGTPKSDEERFAVLDKVYEVGALHWDTADMYGDSEDVIGKWFKKTGKRSEIFLATKFANKTGDDGKRAIDSSPEYAKQACTKSLQRLGIDCIDLYYCHRIDKTTPIEKTVAAMVELKNEGKIKYLGFSEISSDALRRACKVHHIDAVEIEYSPFSIEIESPQIALLKTCRELGVATVAYSPLGRGLLTGQYKSPSDFEAGDFRTFAPRFSEENFPKNLKLVDAIGALAKKKGCSPAQLSLAWVLDQGDDIFAIPGTQKIKYLEENMGALDVKLTSAEEKEMRSLIEGAEVHGGRYPEAISSFLFSDSAPL